MKRLLAAICLTSVGMSAMAQWNNDSTELDSYGKYRIGGYGEMVAAFKNHGINRFYGGSDGTLWASVVLLRSSEAHCQSSCGTLRASVGSLVRQPAAEW